MKNVKNFPEQFTKNKTFVSSYGNVNKLLKCEPKFTRKYNLRNININKYKRRMDFKKKIREIRREIVWKRRPVRVPRDSPSENSGGRVSIAGLDPLFRKDRNIDTKSYWMIVLLFCLVTCYLQLMNVILEYKHLQPATEFGLVDESEAEEVQIPLIYLCPNKIYNEKRMKTVFWLKYLKTFHKMYLGSSSDVFRLPGVNTETIWNLWQLDPSELTIEVKCSTRRGDHSCVSPAQVSQMDTVLGRCTIIYFNESLKTYGFTTSIHITTPVLTEDFQLVFSLGTNGSYFVYNLREATRLMKATQYSFLISREKSVKLNLKNRPCNDDQMDLCEELCIAAAITGNIGCSLPFLSDANIPNCTSESEFSQAANEIESILNRDLQCNCPAKCHRINYILETNIMNIKEDSVGIQLMFNSNRFLMTRDYQWYSFLQLIIDIAGSLGFFLDINLLVFYELFEVMLFRERDLKIKKRLTRIPARPIKSLPKKSNIQKSSDEIKITITGFDRLFSPQSSRFQKVLWSFTLLVICSICGQQVYDIVFQYIEGTPATLTEMETNTQVTFPVLTFCPYKPIEFKESVSLHKLWSDTTIRPFMMQYSSPCDSGFIAFEKGKMVEVPGLTGLCISVIERCTTTYRGISTRIRLNFLLNFLIASTTAPISKFFLHDIEDDVRFLNPDRAINVLNTPYQIAQITHRKGIYLNHRNRRCLNATEAANCFSQCIDNKLQRELSCSLPLLSKSSLASCNSSETMRKAIQHSHAVLINITYKQCGCPRKCIENIYDIKIATNNQKKAFGSLEFYFPNNNVLVIKEVIQLNLYTMFAKVCGNIGFYLGFSFLTVFEAVEILWKLTIKKIKVNPSTKRCFQRLLCIR